MAELCVPGVSIGFDFNASLQQNGAADTTKKVDGVKFGFGGGLKPGSLGAGGQKSILIILIVIQY